MKKLHFLFVLFLALGFAACNKDQAAVKKMAGTWKVDMLDVYENGTLEYSGAPEEAMNFVFEECKLKEDEWCDVTITYPEDGMEDGDEPAYYQVTNDGEKMIFDTDLNLATTDDRIDVTIVELEKDHLMFHFTDTYDDNGTTMSTKYQFHLSPK